MDPFSAENSSHIHSTTCKVTKSGRTVGSKFACFVTFVCFGRKVVSFSDPAISFFNHSVYFLMCEHVSQQWFHLICFGTCKNIKTPLTGSASSALPFEYCEIYISSYFCTVRIAVRCAGPF